MIDEQNTNERQIKAAIWYVKHKELLRKLGLGALLALDVIFMVYVLYAVGRDFVSSPRRRAQEAALIQSGPQAVRAQPLDLQLGGVDLLRVGEVTDIIASVRNPNENWYARFDYVIGIGDNTEKHADGFLLPGQERPFFRSVRASGAGTPVFNIENLVWKKVSAHDTADYSAFRDEHLNFEIKNAQFLPALVEDKGTASRAKFAIVNKTAYSYFAPTFIVSLYRGGTLVGIQSTVIDQFKTGETREVELSWFDRIGAVSNTEVVPAIDIFNQEVYMK
ncbi:hypothetical protein A3B21_01855 [Candidatus Uhrbacteria bacterium RIFCSPLOWO2_01_FULL_47_24]|uniref:Uncharacterized protein n=1 Tax=Candidatus Uhrbacteria bacterium RIFCSPLOWO2_01_FULL_47_24 TaxID=1802401 RepID=A0A1F7UPC7_9BACT|nr:MAG: hypothetical protein A2753_01605 [Candidatus Uhrbacteria bacterium RIFCSPHIGHO2_01_FULL_47_11]OGL67913.1 MAG: hypothetical protein A3D58_05050 [Candidatus Uhrbacteria bacterium RIFCSPHIGHO2_02_FULL_46_47]OGL75184.1 MAG: hypothetical protein A3F52_04040 [Candidatus Uhrbacteria bacterium RIFCSPHIGHO2_12_FULL_47_11]OGL80099.1 MAG: hypothetical protein A3B21_01855 [Candidatus Uhrbacteria bacterium RIFCSPLOWO2_01_FULL_47_24]OGL84885.1 MAG: hypothetical protein A3J03_04240 [Candidatus Uhrbact